MGARSFALALACVFASCALPASHREFSVPAAPGAGGEFASSQDLLVAGLVTEAMAYSKLGRFLEAENRLRQADYATPHNPRIQYSLAVAMNQTGQSDDAKVLLEQLLAKSPDDPNYLTALADVEYSLGSTADAKHRLKLAFTRFKEAGNAAQAARLARSIANLAFIEGREQEALCYSYEALALSPVPEQLGWHARLLVALNYPDQAEEMIKAAMVKNRAIVNHAGVQHSLALARYALGNLSGAVEAEELAIDHIPDSPELGSEINAAWYLMKQELPNRDTSADAEELDEQQREAAVMFRERARYEVVAWPVKLREKLDAVTAKE